MRIPFTARSAIAPIAPIAAITGPWFAAVAHASASADDLTSAIRGSLGASIEELALNTRMGSGMFLLNATFALIFVATAALIAGGRSRRRRRSRPENRDGVSAAGQSF